MCTEYKERWWENNVYYTSTVFRTLFKNFPVGASGKESVCQCRRHKRCGFNPWVGKNPWRGNGNPFHYSCLEKIPWTEEPGRLQPIGSKTVRHDLTDWAHMHSKVFYKPHLILKTLCKVNILTPYFKYERTMTRLQEYTKTTQYHTSN